MKSAFLTQIFTDTPMMVVGLVIFFVAFNLLVARLFLSKSAKSQCERMSMLPLSEEGGHER